RLHPGDRVIICPPNPGWVQAATDAHAYDTLDCFVRKVIAPTGATVSLMISGDWHHYARYSGPDRQLITAGGGGAYLYPTHQLPLGLLGAWVWPRLPFLTLPYPLPLLVAALLYLPVIAVVSSQLVSGYLLVASMFNVNVNELFAGQGIIDSKGFLRLHIGADG